MAYKQKGPSMYKDKLTVNRNGYNGTPEGRAKSSMAQKEVHSMFYQNKPGAPDMKTGKYAHSFEKEGAPKLKGNQHKIDKNKDGKISKTDFDMMNKPGAPKKDEKALARYKERNEKNKAFYEERKDEFKKDSEGVLRDKRGTSVKDRRAEYNAQMRDKAKYETKKPGTPGVKDVIKKGKKVAKKVVSKVKKSRAYKGAKEVGQGFKIIGQTIANPVRSIKSDIKEYKRRKAAEKKLKK